MENRSQRCVDGVLHLGKNAFVDDCYKSLYRTFQSCAKFVNNANIGSIHFMQDCIVEVLGVNPSAQVASIKDLTNKEAILRIPGAGDSEAFRFSRGGWQGGVATPDQFNIVMAAALKDVWNSWRDRGLSFSMSDDNEDTIHYPGSLWADNVILCANSMENISIMV